MSAVRARGSACTSLPSFWDSLGGTFLHLCDLVLSLIPQLYPISSMTLNCLRRWGRRFGGLGCNCGMRESAGTSELHHLFFAISLQHLHLSSTSTSLFNIYIYLQHLHLSSTSTSFFNIYISLQHLHLSSTSIFNIYIFLQHLHLSSTSISLFNIYIFLQHRHLSSTGICFVTYIYIYLTLSPPLDY